MEEEPNSRILKFIDVGINLDDLYYCGMDSAIYNIDKNDSFVMGTEIRGRHRTPPGERRLGFSTAIVKSILLGRMQRFSELQMPDHVVEEAITRRIIEFVLEGYPYSLLRAAVFSANPRRPYVAKLRLLTVATIRRMKVRGVIPAYSPQHEGQ